MDLDKLVVEAARGRRQHHGLVTGDPEVGVGEQVRDRFGNPPEIDADVEVSLAELAAPRPHVAEHVAVYVAQGHVVQELVEGQPAGSARPGPGPPLSPALEDVVGFGLVQIGTGRNPGKAQPSPLLLIQRSRSFGVLTPVNASHRLMRSQPQAFSAHTPQTGPCLQLLGQLLNALGHPVCGEALRLELHRVTNAAQLLDSELTRAVVNDLLQRLPGHQGVHHVTAQLIGNASKRVQLNAA